MADSAPDLSDLEVVRDQLVEDIQHIDAQIAARNADLDQLRVECWEMGKEGAGRYFAAEADHRQWKASAVAAKRHKVRELKDVKAKIKAANSTYTATQSTRRYKNLRRAVREHQQAVMEAGWEPTKADRWLWAILDDYDRLDDDSHG